MLATMRCSLARCTTNWNSINLTMWMKNSWAHSRIWCSWDRTSSMSTFRAEWTKSFRIRKKGYSSWKWATRRRRRNLHWTTSDEHSSWRMTSTWSTLVTMNSLSSSRRVTGRSSTTPSWSCGGRSPLKMTILYVLWRGLMEWNEYDVQSLFN